jgi:hypothetical protein
MRDLLFGLGLACLVFFGSTLDSEGWAGWVAAAGTGAGLLLMLMGGSESGAGND